MTRLIEFGILIVVMAALVGGSYFMGVRNGEANITGEILKARAESAAEKDRIDAEVRNLPRDELRRRALEFVRTPGG